MKKIRRKKVKRKFKLNILIIFLFLAVLGISSAYAAYIANNKVDTKGGIVLPFDGVGITKVTLEENINCGFEIYSVEHSYDSITVNVDLPALNCLSVYTVTIENNTSSPQEITDILSVYNNGNNDIIYEFTGVKIGDIILSNQSINATLTIKYDPLVLSIPNDTTYSAIIKFSFAEYISSEPIAMISYDTTNWTNNNVIASISFDTSDVTILNNSGSDEYVFTSNGTFTFSYENSSNVSGSATATVSWIDKNAPDTFVPVITDIGETTISLYAITTDDASGVAGYYYSSDNGYTWAGPENTSYTITGLTPDVVYNLMVKAVDNAGNETDSYSLYARTLSNTSTGLPVVVIPNDNGEYFVFTNFPSGINYVGDHWDGDTFSFVLAKPTVPPNNGQNTFSFTLPITNSSTYNWTNGSVSAAIGTGVFNKVTPSLSSATVVAGGSVSITHTIQAKIETNVTDSVKATVSFTVNGSTRYLYIDFYWIPNNSYAIFFSANEGSGEMSTQVCTSSASCQINANNYTRAGYSFGGWATSPNGPVVYNNSANIPAGTFSASSKVTLYAVWN